MKAKQAASNALVNVLDAQAGEKLIIICDDILSEIGSAFAAGAVDCGLWVRLVVLDSSTIRTDIPLHLKEILTTQNPDIYINMLAGRSEETSFRIKVIKMERRRKVRLGHCPGISMDMLTRGALALTDPQYRRMQGFADTLIHRLSGAETIRLTSPSGTDLIFNVRNRDFFTDTKINWQTLKWMNLPVGETIVAPREDSLSGILVCDSAIGGIGLIKSPVRIEADAGKAIKVSCRNKNVLSKVNSALKTDSWSSTIGEFAFGINPKARVCNEFLETEKIKGSCHIAFGNNSEFPGGKNPSFNHMDFLVTEPTVEVTFDSGEKLRVVDKGRFAI
jgi:leucyl aminopeptidase (aminopeptidase T)